MKKLALFVTVLIITGCGSLKKSKLLSNQEILAAKNQKFVHTYMHQSSNKLNDSASQYITIELQPKGTFKLDWSKGFEGEAEKLKITGKHERVLQANGQISTKQKTMLSATQLQQQKLQLKQVNTNRKAIINSWLLTLFPILLIAYWWYKKVKLR